MQIPTITGWHRYSPRLGAEPKGPALGQMGGAYGWYRLTDRLTGGNWVYSDHGTACFLARCALATSCNAEFLLSRVTATGGDVNVMPGWYSLQDRRWRHLAWIWANGRGADAIQTLMAWGPRPVTGGRTMVLDARGSEVIRSC